MSHLRGSSGLVSVPISSDSTSKNTNTINNNVVIKTDKPRKDIGVNTDTQDVKEISDGVFVVYPKGEDTKERDIESANARLEQIKSQQPENTKLIEALSMIIDILYNNPLLVNKFIIPSSSCLNKLVELLTNADSVEITINDATCDCNCISSKVSIAAVDSIYVSKDGSVNDFRYYYTEAKQILEANHISTKYMLVD